MLAVTVIHRTPDLEWRVIYVGSSESEEHDQELDSVLLGPIKQGVNKFVFQACPQIMRLT